MPSGQRDGLEVLTTIVIPAQIFQGEIGGRNVLCVAYAACDRQPMLSMATPPKAETRWAASSENRFVLAGVRPRLRESGTMTLRAKAITGLAASSSRLRQRL